MFWKRHLSVSRRRYLGSNCRMQTYTNFAVDLIVFFLIAYFIFYNNYNCYNKNYYFLFLSGNQVVGEKISLGVFNNETDWSQEKIEKVRKGFLINSIMFIVLLHIR